MVCGAKIINPKNSLDKLGPNPDFKPTPDKLKMNTTTPEVPIEIVEIDPSLLPPVPSDPQNTQPEFEQCFYTDIDNMMKKCGAEYTAQIEPGFTEGLICFDEKADDSSCPPEKKQKAKETFCPNMKKFYDCQKQIEFTCNDESDIRQRQEDENRFNKLCGDFLKIASPESRSQGFTLMMPWTLLLLFFV